jgi:hypothetical protein
MFSLLSLLVSFSRDRRAAVRQSACVATGRASRSSTRMRKGVHAACDNPWRRRTTGSNHISAFGVWREGSRRMMTRINRTGETRWHRLPSSCWPARRNVMP